MFKILLRPSTDQNYRKRKALGRAEIHFREAKTLQNHAKTQIAGLKVQIHDSRSIWLINSPDRTGRSQSAQTSSGSDAGHRRSAIANDRIGESQRGLTKWRKKCRSTIADDRIGGSHRRYQHRHQWHCDCDIVIASGPLITCTDQRPRSHRHFAINKTKGAGLLYKACM